MEDKKDAYFPECALFESPGFAKMMLKVMVKMGRIMHPFFDEDSKMLQNAALPPGE